MRPSSTGKSSTYQNHYLLSTHFYMPSLDGIIDWTVTAAREMAKDKLSASAFIALQDMCQFKEYEYTPECKSLVDRLSGEDKSVMDWRREILTSNEFINKQFDPLKHQDWAYVKFIAEHL